MWIHQHEHAEKEPTIDDALRSALHTFADAANRWQSLIEKGATDDELMAAIGREFGTKGNKRPEFSWNSQFGVKTLRGKRLLAKVREVMAIGAPGQQAEALDDFTAPICDECHRIDGAHSDTCGQCPDALTFEDYLDFAQNGCSGIKDPKSQARKWQISKEQDGTIIHWKRMKAEGRLPQQQAAKKAPKKSKRLN